LLGLYTRLFLTNRGSYNYCRRAARRVPETSFSDSGIGCDTQEKQHRA